MKPTTALLIIDVQKGFLDPIWGKRNNKDAEKNIADLLLFFRSLSYPIIHIQHLSTSSTSPLRPGQAGVELMDFVKPRDDEFLITKKVNSAFIQTGLEKTLRDNKIDTLIMVGLTTDHCVSTTARMAANLGFKVYVIADATCTFERIHFDGSYLSAEAMHNHALASLHKEFADVVNTATIKKLWQSKTELFSKHTDEVKTHTFFQATNNLSSTSSGNQKMMIRSNL